MAAAESRRAAVLRAAQELLADGSPASFTLEALVEHSGVARATIYRYWPSLKALLVEVMRTSAPQHSEPELTADMTAALRTIMRTSVTYLNDPVWGNIVAAIAVYRRLDDDFRAADDDLTRDRERAVALILDAARRSGSVPPDLDAPEAAAFLWGPIVFAHLTSAYPLDHDLADDVVDRFLRILHPS